MEMVRDGTAICPHCEAILDTSILGPMPDAHEEDAPVRQKPPAKRPSRARKPASVASAQGDDVRYGTQRNPAAREPSETATAATLGDPFEQLRDIATSFRKLHFEDKLTTASAALLVLASFFPWRSTDDGDDLGILTVGFVTAACGVGVLSAVWLRSSGKLLGMLRRMLPLAVLGLGGLAAVIAITFALTARQRMVRTGVAIMVAEPDFGAYLAIMAATGVLVGAFLARKHEG